MEDTPLKRQREEDDEFSSSSEFLKKQKSYRDILSFLEEEEDDPTNDLSTLITTLQQEICSSSGEFSGEICSSGDGRGEEEDEAERVMRHLLEASDDELGIPTSSEEAAPGGGESSAPEFDAGEMLTPVGDGLWEIEDDAANYYTLLQSELFM